MCEQSTPLSGSVFCCPVCGAALTREVRTLRCPAGHSYDLAKEGYVNLLPANYRHSASPGDDREMVAARTRFLDGDPETEITIAIVVLTVYVDV